MKSLLTLGPVSGLALMLAATAPASAQTAATGIDALNDRIDDVRVDAERDLDDANDASRFGAEQFRPGWSGELALTFAGTSGNTDTRDLAMAGRMHYGAGVWQHTFGFGADYGEEDGDRSKQQYFLTYEANYYLNDNFYIFGLGREMHDDFGAYKDDAFIGAGPGFRVINTPDMAWRLQAGVGARYLDPRGENDSTEGALIGSSRFFYKFSDVAFLTNDTDIIGSDAGTVVSNDLGLNFAMTDTLSTRISYRTDYNSDRIPGRKKTDNTLGVSLVMGF